MISPLDRKLLRNLRQMGGQLITIGLVVASGVAAYICTQSAVDSLESAQDKFYTEQRFADVFGMLRRAPNAIAGRLEAVDGVALVQTRVMGSGSIPLHTMSEPASAIVVSLAPHGDPLNSLHLVSGRRVTIGRSDEVVLSDAFAAAHGIEPGDRIPLVLGGVRRRMRVVGTALSPEYVMIFNVGDMAVDDRRRSVVFMDQQAVAAALDMQGAFNSVALRLAEGASEAAVIAGVDAVLSPFGGLGAHGRERQMSHFVLTQELSQLKNMSTSVPPLFLFVAAFLLHVVLTRLVQLQRPQVAALKALGYRNRQIGLHYLKLASVIVLLGAVLGVLFGGWLADGLVSLYARYFRFPTLISRIDRSTAAVAIIASSIAGVVGTLTSVRSILKLAPAEAMRPPAPQRYRRGMSDWPLVKRWLTPSAQMILREVQRRPVRVILSSLGIAIAVGICVVARFFGDAMDYLVNVQMHEAQRWDVQAIFSEPRPESTLTGLSQLPGVFLTEGVRTVPCRVSVNQVSRDIPLIGYPERSELLRVVASRGRPTTIPDDGVLLTRTLGELLGVDRGDTIRVEILEGDRRRVELPVSGLVDELFGLQGHMTTNALHAMLDQEPSITQALFRVDPLEESSLDHRLSEEPDVVGITHKDRMIAEFREQSAQNMKVFSLILTLFAVVIAIGVVYNNARVSLSMRSRDLASLRVLGLTIGEISAILLGELAIQVMLAIPIGLVLGYAMAVGMATGAADPEVYRLPIIISSRTYAFATVVTLGAAAASALLVRRKLDRLDLIAVLKTRQ